VTLEEFKQILVDNYFTIQKIVIPQVLHSFHNDTVISDPNDTYILPYYGWSMDDRKVGREMAVGLQRLRPLLPPVPQITGAGIRIGIIDDGIDITHPEFLAADGRSRVVAYRTFIGGSEKDNIDDIRDDRSHHGTHVTGIAAGNTCGVAPGADLVFARIQPSISTSTDLANAIAWMINQVTRTMNSFL
jgi:subtilisin family serine protease